MDMLAELLKELTPAFFLPLLEKEPDELTDPQRFAIALSAGCEFETVWENARLVVRTKWRVAIQKVDGRFIVREFRR